MSDVKIFAMYLPQFHEIKENSRFWGKGFTDWVGVKNSRPQFCGHNQPRVPLGGQYYDLSQKESIARQCSLAREYGIHGFAIYHYWFNDQTNLLTRPSEIILNHPDLDIRFCFAWDNTSWVRTWSRIRGNDWFPGGDYDKKRNKKTKEVLVPYELGGKTQWKNHFEYLLPFFKDSRYEKQENKPCFLILNPDRRIMEMSAYWEMLARKSGFGGINFIYRWDPVYWKQNRLIINRQFYIYEPVTSGWNGLCARCIDRARRELGIKEIKKYSYDRIWRRIIRRAERNKEPSAVYGAFVDYDDSPRRGVNGRVVTGGTPDKFERYMERLLQISRNQGKEYLFLTAWNEWGEGAYLEPDERWGYGYLEAFRRAAGGDKDI